MKNKQWQGQLNIIQTILYILLVSLGRREEQSVAVTAKHYTNYTIYILLVSLGRREEQTVGGTAKHQTNYTIYIAGDSRET